MCVLVCSLQLSSEFIIIDALSLTKPMQLLVLLLVIPTMLCLPLFHPSKSVGSPPSDV
jgi:hypothetical protein